MAHTQDREPQERTVKTAIDFAGIVGKYIRMERDVTDEERAAGDVNETVGMECTVVSVLDERDGSVTVMSDYGYAFTMTRISINTGQWRLHIWPDEKTRMEHL